MVQHRVLGLARHCIVFQHHGYTGAPIDNTLLWVGETQECAADTNTNTKTNMRAQNTKTNTYSRAPPHPTLLLVTRVLLNNTDSGHSQHLPQQSKQWD